MVAHCYKKAGKKSKVNGILPLYKYPSVPNPCSDILDRCAFGPVCLFLIFYMIGVPLIMQSVGKHERPVAAEMAESDLTIFNNKLNKLRNR